jgi:hypothetical protein
MFRYPNGTNRLLVATLALLSLGGCTEIMSTPFWNQLKQQDPSGRPKIKVYTCAGGLNADARAVRDGTHAAKCEARPHPTDGDEVAVKSIITNKEDTNTHTATSTGGDSDDTADSTLTIPPEITADSIPSDPYLTGNYEWPARPHVCNAVDPSGNSLCPP